MIPEPVFTWAAVIMTAIAGACVGFIAGFIAGETSCATAIYKELEQYNDPET